MDEEQLREEQAPEDARQQLDEAKALEENERIKEEARSQVPLKHKCIYVQKAHF